MPHITRTHRRLIAMAIWLFGLGLFVALGIWNLESSRLDAENRLIGEAARSAAQVASLLSITGVEPDAMAARAIVSGAMEDERIYAVKVENRHGIVEGQRRNYLWEPVPWDDEIAENSVQGMNTFRLGGQPAGQVYVWLSPRLNDEEDSLLASRELWRFFLAALIWTTAFLLVLWQWGDFHRLGRFWNQKANAGLAQNEGQAAENRILNMKSKDAGASDADNSETGPAIIDAGMGRRYQRRHQDSWLVTAGMFRQTFARGPALIGRLYSEGETAGLCHLGRMLEQAAPCVGAEKLAQAAREMQSALNNPDCKARALPVEECARALEEVLNALCGNGPWRSRPGNL